jgi:hypothetical protein
VAWVHIVWRAQTPYREKGSGRQPMHEFSLRNAWAYSCCSVPSGICKSLHNGLPYGKQQAAKDIHKNIHGSVHVH